MKRGSSGLSLIMGIDKPLGMTSHDVVNRCRRIFGEKRVGHNGTLDPMASGVLLVSVGPATRLNPYLSTDTKSYRFTISFGCSTDTDDASGLILRRGTIDAKIFDEAFAQEVVTSLVGKQKQIPPSFSAIKVKGKRAYEAARGGTIIPLEPRDIEIYSSTFFGIGKDDGRGYPCWDVCVHVSKGSYIRSIGRDVGKRVGVPAHVSSIQRLSSGFLPLENCVSLEALEEVKIAAALDPVALLAHKIVFVPDDDWGTICNGREFLPDQYKVYLPPSLQTRERATSCSTGIVEYGGIFQAKEIISVVSHNKLMALYEFDHEKQRLRARCVFSSGVSRGRNF